ncbi:putative Regulatory protein TetR [uncultured Paludibacter sp.]|nr:putative Regulatory protein TetR [uncultured Paludibacter sp.]
MTKKEIIIQTASELFLKYGFKKISVNEICKNAQVSRKTYYTYFKNKEELVKQIIGDVADFGFQLYDEIFNDATLNFGQKMEKGMLAKIELTKKWSMEFFTDLMQMEDGDLLNYYNGIAERSFKLMYNFMETAQKKDELDPNLNLNYIMWLLKKQLEHINEPELLSMFSNIEDLTRQMSQVFVYGILSQNDKDNIK